VSFRNPQKARTARGQKGPSAVIKEDDEPPDPKRHPKRIEDEKAKCPRHTIARYRKLIEAAWAAGWWCKRGGNKHIICFSPDGKYIVGVPATPSGNRTYRNKRAEFRRGGLDV
jgi:hypothetical protein